MIIYYTSFILKRQMTRTRGLFGYNQFMEKPFIVYDHPHFLIACKPSGLNFHSEEDAGIVVLLSELTDRKLYSVHRLDKMTSGLLILAKTPETAAEFTHMFETRQIEKYYLAISTRKPKKKQGWIKGDMAKARRGDYKLLSTMENPAITQFISASLRPNERVFLVKPHTGKTHQIRVALKAIGSPCAGDERYAASEEASKEDRGYLHAYALKFRFDDDEFSFALPPKEGERFISAEMKERLGEWSEPWKCFS